MNGDFIAQFRTAMAEAGILCEGDIIADGERHRFTPDGDRRENAIYQLWDDDRPAGWFKDYRRNIYQTWRQTNGATLTEASAKPGGSGWRK